MPTELPRNQVAPPASESRGPRDAHQDEAMLLATYARLSPLALGASLGLCSALLLFGLTAVLVIKGGIVVGPHLGLLSQFFPGYTVSWQGAIVGMVYGFSVGALGGAVFANLVNLSHRAEVRGGLRAARSREISDGL